LEALRAVQAEQLLSGRYRLIDVIGCGGMSIVWRGRDEILGRTVAVKVLSTTFVADRAVRGRILDEARSAAMLSHPHVANVFDYGESRGEAGELVPFVVMEMLDGPPLAERLRSQRMAPGEALTVCAEVAAAVAAAHEHGLVHRDVKPGNIVLTQDGAKLLDFGIAAFSGEPATEADGHLLGTPTYVAPELIDGGAVTPAVDVYALGVLMHRVLADDLPWSIDTPSQAVTVRMSAPPRPLPAMPGVPAPVNDVCDRCLLSDPDLRPTAAEVARILAAAAQAGAPPRNWRRRAAVAAVVAAVLAGVSAIAWPAISSADRDSGVVMPAAVVPESLPSPVGPTAASPSVVSSTPVGRTQLPAVDVPDPPQVSPRPTRPAATPTATVTPTPPPSSAPPPSPAGQPVSAVGGTVYVVCQGPNATLKAVVPADGYTAKDVVYGPAKEVRAKLVSPTHESDVKVQCGATGPKSSVTERSL
jgi:eukaryotic-like serine/threonine-protein kinase